MKKALFGFFDEININTRTMQIGSLVALAALAIGGGWYGMHRYTIHRSERAQLLMGDCMDEFRKAQHATTPLWHEVEFATEQALKEASGTALEPYFVVMQAQAYAAQGKIAEAVEHMDRALAQLPESSPYHAYFAVTQALFKLQSTAAEVSHAGLVQLQAFAADEHNWFADLAAYHVGQWYWLHNQLTEARQAWQQLVDNEALKDSPWVELAQQKLLVL